MSLLMSAVEGVVPEKSLSLFDLSDRYDMTPAQLAVFHRMYGLDQVPVWSDSLTELIESSVAQLLDSGVVDRQRVRWLIHAHTGTEVNLAGRPVLEGIAQRQGLTQATTFGTTSNNCASTIVAIPVVDRLLIAGETGDRALVVTADLAFTPILQVIPGSSVTGDAAVSCLFGRDGSGHRILVTHADTYGEHAGCEWQGEELSAAFDAQYVWRVATVMRRTLARAGLDWADIRMVLPHNVNEFSWRRIDDEAGIPVGMVFLDQVPHTAHCFGADSFLNFAIADRAGAFRPGDRLMMVTVGMGAVFAAAILEYEPPR
jgi:3-oxoacyl-[acyl-carrier-protein] synthase-3